MLTISRLPLPAEGAATVPIDLAVEAGQCVTVQCNDEQGRVLVAAIAGSAAGPQPSVRFKGKPLNIKDGDTSGRIGVCVPEDEAYPRMKVKAYLDFWCGLYGEHRRPLGDLLQAAGLLDAADKLIARLSASERRRLQLVRCAVHDPELIVLENPEQGLDLASCAIVRQMVSGWTAKGKALLITCSSTESAVSLSGDAYRLTSYGLKRLVARDETDEPGEEDRGETNGREDRRGTNGGENPEDTKDTNGKEAERGDLKEKNSEAASQPAAASEPAYPNSGAPRLRIAKIPAKAGDKVILVDPSEILYVESSDGQSMLHLETETLPCAWSLNELEARLAPFDFYRCHRSYLVNLKRVREVIVWTRNSYSLVMADPSKRAVPLSKGRYEDLKRLIGI
nr:LytTR family transcriptional regulator DNA-binding domain-containing protein [Cohnella thailandensis]